MRKRKMLVTIRRVKSWVDNNWPLVISILASLSVVGALLGPGYILTYDMVFSPHVFFNLHATIEGYALYNGLPVQLVLKCLSFLIPMDIVQKIILFLIFFLSIYGIYRLLPVPSKLARILGGLLYAFNPFVYDRLMAGHWKLLLAYALTPFAIKIFWHLLTKPTGALILSAGAVWAGIALINPHHLIILGLLFMCLCLAIVRSKKTIFASILTIACCLIFSSWWIIPLVMTQNITSGFGLGDFMTFTAHPDPTYGIWPTLLSLQGFWFHDWLPLGHFIPAWPSLLLIWLFPVALGFWSIFVKKHPYGRLIMGSSIAAIISIAFVAGPSAGYGDITTWIFLHIPGLNGMRESHKLMLLVALFYSAATVCGMDVLLGAIHQRIVKGVIILVEFAVLIAFGWPLIWGAHGQLMPVQYPTSWQTLYNHREYSMSGDNILVLPYELYLNKTFAGRLVADPAPVYFGDRAIASNDPKLPGIYTYQSHDDQLLSNAIARHDVQALRQVIHQRHIRYILLIQSDDASEFLWVDSLSHSVLAYDKKSVVLVLTQP